MKIIAIEGNDGAGKGLQTNLLKEKIEANGKRCRLMSFPQYDRFFGKEIGNMLSGRQAVRADVVDAKSMALWYAMDRWQAFQDMDLTGIDCLLLNRYTLSNAVYQSLRTEKTASHTLAQWVFDLEHDKLCLPRPHAYVLLDVDEALSRQNVAQKGYRDYVGSEPDVYENAGHLLRNVRAAYLHFAQTLDNVFVIESMRDGQMLPPETIAADIWAQLLTYGLIP